MRIFWVGLILLLMQAGKVRLKCLATIAGLYWKTAEIQLSQEHPKLSQVLQVEGEYRELIKGQCHEYFTLIFSSLFVPSLEMPKYFFINGFNFFGNSYLFKIHFEQILVQQCQ